jgi:hypothetical protein
VNKRIIAAALALVPMGWVTPVFAAWDGDEIMGSVFSVNADDGLDPWQLNWANGSDPVPATISFTEVEFERFSYSADFGPTTLTLRIVNDSNFPNITYPTLEFAFMDLDVESGAISGVTELQSNFSLPISIAFTSNSITLNTGMQNTNPGDEFIAVFSFATVQPQTAEELIAVLADQVLALNLKKGISNALDSKLMSALATLEDANEKNDVASINKLYAFIANVDAQSGKMIDESEAEALITAAEAIIELLMG